MQVENIFIKTTESRKDPKPYTWKSAPAQGPGVVGRDIQILITSLKTDCSIPTLPPKTYRVIGQASDSEVEARRKGLENFLNEVLIWKDDRLRKSTEWAEFLEFPIKSQDSSSKKTSHDSWIDELNELDDMTTELRRIIAYRDRLDSAGQSSVHQMQEARKIMSSFTYRLKILSESLNKPEIFNSLSDGELLRRRDLIDTLKTKKEQLSKDLNIRKNVSERSDGFSITPGSSAPSSARTSRRVFGVIEETETTKKLDNNGLVQLQSSMISEQDQQFSTLLSTVRKQKEIGLAIGDELDVQLQLLNDLDDKVDLTNARMKYAHKQAKKLLN